MMPERGKEESGMGRWFETEGVFWAFRCYILEAALDRFSRNVVAIEIRLQLWPPSGIL